MFHACGLYVSCLRPLSTTHGYGEDCVLGRKEAIRGACCALWLWEAGLQTTGLGSCFGLVLWGLVLFGRSFRGSCFGSFFSWFVLFVARAFDRSFRGSCFWSFFSWFVLLVVLFVVRASGSCFWGLVCVFCSML